jgi:hypothetical protein
MEGIDRRVNCKDIELARRIIAAFEGRALGRHNSSVDLRDNEVARRRDISTGLNFDTGRVVSRQEETTERRVFPEDMIRRAVVIIQPDWLRCEVGQVCTVLPGGADPRTDLRWNVIPPMSRLINQFQADVSSQMREMDYLQFEAIRVLKGSDIQFMWRRIR